MLLLYISYLFCLLLFVSSGGLSIHLIFGFSFDVIFDSCSLIFCYTLVSISFSVLLWSYFYLGSELVFKRWFSIILCFLFSMFLLIFASNLISLFVAWDLLGFRSFFLVIFFRSRSSLAGGMLTCLRNRIGDVLLLVLLGFILSCLLRLPSPLRSLFQAGCQQQC